MSLFLESIKVKHKQFFNLDLHQQRMNDTRKAFFGVQDDLDLHQIVQLPDFLTDALYKCRVLYAEKIEKIEFQPYQVRKIASLKLIECHTIDYHLKYADRQLLNDLFAQKGDCDDILIVRNGLITDTSYTNVAFWNGKNWLTPAKPLLNGIQRQKLLQENKIITADLGVEDLKYFQKAKLFNAMLDWENAMEILIENIY